MKIINTSLLVSILVMLVLYCAFFYSLRKLFESKPITIKTLTFYNILIIIALANILLVVISYKKSSFYIATLFEVLTITLLVAPCILSLIESRVR